MWIDGIKSTLWPGLLLLCIAITAWGIDHGSGTVAFNVAYFGLALVLWLLERLLPFEPSWNQQDGQMAADLAHTLMSKAPAQLAVVGGAAAGIAHASANLAASTWWPNHWAMPIQVLLGLVIIEFGLYWAHRLSHEWPVLWRFHAIHHSVRRLWFFNTGRFHIVNSLISMLLGLPLLYLAGAPGMVITWVSAITAFIGMLTHCNVDMHCRRLSYVFNTPVLHRWHHRPNTEEGDTNYGENLVLFDQLFGTFYHPRLRPPAQIGIKEQMPRDFIGQLLAPFRWRSLQGGHWRRDRSM